MPAASSVAMPNSSSSRPVSRNRGPGRRRRSVQRVVGARTWWYRKVGLLEAYARAARKAGFAVARADGGGVASSPDGIRAAADNSLADVIIIDAADRLGAAEDWLRDEFLPALPAKTVVVIASRRPPAAAWRSDPGWRICYG